ncbi:RES family NAD+ phosphorylase [Xanthomonas prunicola]|uniref:RES family NAD+ phosphorylase n=1 Tax=Xanthomonas prunicola TaxID=2053930 RepID=UPI00207850CD|nr:RES family NAD+ phosphorylase [Xanthomonas prunicola]USJ00822.1 RES family NAD+ phosphorylase [Xanthomonas prunicola]
MPLKPPHANFSDLPLKVKELNVTSLKRIGRHPSGEPYFGKHAANRFDDPNKRFGTCYCGQQLDTALAETVLHDELPENGQFRIRNEDIENRYLVTFAEGSDDGILRLADLTGANLKRLGGDNTLSAENPYDVPQKWGAAVYAHSEKVDGFIYISKQLNDKKAVVIFDRAQKKFGDATYTPLSKAPGLSKAKNRLGIVTIGAA